ncbi:cytoplasm protein [Ceratobasidium sp. AG-Ba]|nr:cytoplasm protein [Ceratobasidium sp. AG-Ba]
MLPTFNSNVKRYKYRSLTQQTPVGSLRERLLARSRITNLGAVVFALILAISLFSNLRYAFLLSRAARRFTTTPAIITDTVSYNRSISKLDHLVVVAGHAIWKGGSAADHSKDSSWVLDTAQEGHGNPSAFYAHITKGAQIALADERSLLVFSGGQTRKPTHLTEAQSYLSLAFASGTLPSAPLPFARATTEDYALDSFQNLLFSIARFKERTGRYPRKVTVVGFGVKRARFEKLHARALRWGGEFVYVGVDVAAHVDMEISRAGEVSPI